MKTTTATVAFIALLLALTTACGGNKTPAPPTSAVSTTTPAEDKAAAKKAQADADAAKEQELVDSMNAQAKLAYAAATAQRAALEQTPVTSPNGGITYVGGTFTPTPTAAPVAAP